MKNRADRPLADVLLSLCKQGVEEGVFPGVSAGISLPGREGRKRIIACAGTTAEGEQGEEVYRETVFDLASLTKPLATTLSLLHLVGEGLCTLEDNLVDLLGEDIPPDKKDITLAHFLSHSSGLTSYRPYFREFSPHRGSGKKKRLLSRILGDPLEYLTGSDCRYSDPGFIVLGEVIRRLSGMSVAGYFRVHLGEPLGLAGQLFYAEEKDVNGLAGRSCAATGYCPWRGRMIQGEVHDEHGWLLGEMAGHAGLFGTVEGVLTLLEEVGESRAGRMSRLPLDREVLIRALSRKYPQQSWCLGFDTPSQEGYTSAGRYFSPESIGHLGFTGTSFWMDPVEDCIVVLLTNRVHPDPKNNRIREFRPLFHDRIMEAVKDI